MVLLPAFLYGTLLGFFGAIPVAGPVSAIVLRFGLKNQMQRGRLVAAGAAIAEAIYVMAAFLGFSLLIESVPVVQTITRYVTSVILGGLGVYFLFSKVPSSKANAAEPKGKKSAFGYGFGISILNPTLIITWSTVIAAIYSYQLFKYSVANAAFFSLGVSTGIVAWFSLMLRLIQTYQDRLSEIWIKRILMGMGMVLLGLSIWNLRFLF